MEEDNSLENTVAESYAFFQKLIKTTSSAIQGLKIDNATNTNDPLESIHEQIQTLHSDDDMFIGALTR